MGTYMDSLNGESDLYFLINSGWLTLEISDSLVQFLKERLHDLLVSLESTCMNLLIVDLMHHFD